MRFIAPIVEGHGEVQALPILLRRLADAMAPEIELRLNPALRVKAASFLNENDTEYFDKYIELAAAKAKASPKSCVLILLDCEDLCPSQLGPKILQRALKCRPDTAFLVILAHREYETWFLAAAESLRGVCGLRHDLVAPGKAEKIRDAKGWLSEQMPTPYNEPEHQPRMTQKFDFDQAKQVKSFARAHAKLTDFFRAQ